MVKKRKKNPLKKKVKPTEKLQTSKQQINGLVWAFSWVRFLMGWAPSHNNPNKYRENCKFRPKSMVFINFVLFNILSSSNIKIINTIYIKQK